MPDLTPSDTEVNDLTSDFIGEWCDYHHNLHRISHDRRVMQARVLRELEATLPGPVEQVDARDVERYMAQLIRDGYHPHTVVRNLRLIQPFVRWLRHQGMIEAERWLRLAEVKGPRGAYDGQPRPYSPQELRQFWIELERRYPWTGDPDPRQQTAARGEYWVRRWASGYSRWIRVRPYAMRLQVEAIVALALYAGLRRDEIYRISLDDMHYQNEYVRVLSRKGPSGDEKTRVAPMNAAITTAAGNWIEFREQVLAPSHEFPWLSLWAGGGANTSEVTTPMSHQQFSHLLGKVGRGWSLHRLRHTYGTGRYRAGMPLEILQQILGHSRITQTQGYTKIDDDRIIAASRATDEAFLNAVQRPTSPTNR